MDDDGRTTRPLAAKPLWRVSILFALVLSAACSRETEPPGGNPILAPEVPPPTAPPPPPSPPPSPPPAVIDSVEFVTSSSLPSGEEDESYETTIESRGGDSVHTFEVIEGHPPSGLVLESSTGVRRTTLHGTPTRDGTRSFTVVVRDGANRSATRRFTVRIED